MKYELFDYQEAAKATLLRSLLTMAKAYEEDVEERGAVVLAAPTGAGKTVIATAVIESALDGDETTPGIENSTFLWVTDDPSLNKQTLNKMMAASSGLNLNRLIAIENDFQQETLDAGRVYFLNIQKLGSSAHLSKSGVDGRKYSLWDTIANTIRDRPYGFVVVVDEAHRGLSTAKDTRDTIVSRIIGGNAGDQPEVPVVWGISAVPRRFREAMAQRGRTVKSHTVAIEDVRASGLLKDQIILGHTKGIHAAESTLLRHAVEKIREYEARWAAYCRENGDPRVDPILVVQVEDKPSPKSLGELVGTVLEEWPGISPRNIVHTFASHAAEPAGAHKVEYCPPEDIQDRQDVRVVLCKTAITTGWDCPRAEVLVSMRVANDADLITQIMGRMVRTPLARRILTDETLNTVHCILPKFDERAVELIAKQFERGDDGGLAGGTKVVLKPMQLTRNPLLHPSADDAAREPEPADQVEEESNPPKDNGTFWLEQQADQPGPDNDPSLSGDKVGNLVPNQRPRNPANEEGASLFDGSLPTQHVTAQGEQSVFGLLESLPSYTIPRRIRRSGVSRLSALAALLAEKHDGKAIEATAISQARNELLAVIDTRRMNLETKGELAERLDTVAKTRLYERAVTYGSPTEDPQQRQTTIELDVRGIQILMDKAKRLLPEGLATAFVDRLAATDDDVTDAMITTIAVAQDPELPSQIEDRASYICAQWLQKYSSAITRLSAADQEKFDRIRRESDRPLLTTLSLSTSRTEDAEGSEWERHVLSDAAGKFKARFFDWEEHVLREELRHDAVAWYRNPPGGRHSLQIPYVGIDGIRGMTPDFIFIHKVQGSLRASLIDPHGTYLADAVPKLKGLTDYADMHGTEFHRIQSIAKVDGKYRMLNHQDPATREAVREYEGIDAGEVFRMYGTDY
ncbi:DEAD/DEAH box helicase family protein [Micromonospora sp. C51]|uniref:DEAD/DEAH box helicase n=1 Tax=Micromonospora sp. C51 TaxID=2824879 RepID=UPI001B36F461|nr:DEAD/DEAH box helicase family protein [Micromonospora sp. C51]MBQ1051626.1 DEAD/DEAH box helicase family protein [Micromonospora sp. C51]